MHFSSFSGELYLAPLLSDATHLTTIPTDIDGEPRNPTATVIGADEIQPEPSTVPEWESFLEITAPGVAAKK